jgi:hypothetical protein
MRVFFNVESFGFIHYWCIALQNAFVAVLIMKRLRARKDHLENSVYFLAISPAFKKEY